MLFDRRTPPKFKEKLRVAIWPRRNWKRSIRYVLTRMSRLRTAPSAIARGAAAGVLVSFTPFPRVSFHFGGFACLDYARQHHRLGPWYIFWQSLDLPLYLDRHLSAWQSPAWSRNEIAR